MSNTVAPIALGKFIRSQVDQLLPNKFSHVTPKSFTTAMVMKIAIRESQGEDLAPLESTLLDNISEAIQRRLFRYSSRRASE